MENLRSFPWLRGATIVTVESLEEQREVEITMSQVVWPKNSNNVERYNCPFLEDGLGPIPGGAQYF